MALIRGVYAEQCLNCVHVLDLAGELLWVGTFSCARSPTFAIIVLLSTVNLHGSLPAFIPLSICSLVALFPISYCLFQTLSPMSCCRIIEQPSHTTLLMLHIIHVLPLSQNGKLEPKWLRVRKSAVSDAKTAVSFRLLCLILLCFILLCFVLLCFV